MITTAPAFIHAPNRPMARAYRRHDNFFVSTRRQKTDENHGRWEAVAEWGYRIICVSHQQAVELVMVLGSRMYPAPQWLRTEAGQRKMEQEGLDDGDVAMNDDIYLDWLLRYHFRIHQNYSIEKRREMYFAEFIRGWHPGQEELLRGDASPLITWGCLEDEGLRHGAAGDFVQMALSMQPPRI